MLNIMRIFLVSLLILFLTSCGGGGSSNETKPVVKAQGTLYDDVVVGADYKTKGFSAKTDKDGKFNYIEGKVEFYLENLKIGEISSLIEDKKVFLSDMLNLQRGDYTTAKLIKLARLLQSLDTNRNDDIITLDNKKIKTLFTKNQTIDDIDITKLGLDLVSIESVKEELKQTYINHKITPIVPKEPEKETTKEKEKDTSGGSGSSGGSSSSSASSSSSGSIIDTTSPTIKTITPKDKQIGVNLDIVIIVKFSEIIQKPNTDDFNLTDSTNKFVDFDLSFGDDNKTVTIKPKNDLSYETKYTINMAKDIKDKVGNAFVSTSRSFTTKTSTAPTAEAGNNIDDLGLNTTFTLDGSKSIAGTYDIATYKWTNENKGGVNICNKQKCENLNASNLLKNGYNTILLTVTDINGKISTDTLKIKYGTVGEVGANDLNIIIDHKTDRLGQIPEKWIIEAKKKLHIAYQGASHSKQMTVGMKGLMNLDSNTSLIGYKGNGHLYYVNMNGGAANNPNVLDMHEGFASGHLANNADFNNSTADYLDKAENAHINVVFWMWCYQRDLNQEHIDSYIEKMERLISIYGENGSKIKDGTRSVPVTFIFATGPNQEGSKNKLVYEINNKIRQHAKTYNRILFDFYDLESYDPEEKYFGDGDESSSDVYTKYTGVHNLSDYNAYNKPPNGSRGNWAKEYVKNHPVGKYWYNAPAEHSDPIDGNVKTYAMWWLFARLAGWDGK